MSLFAMLKLFPWYLLSSGLFPLCVRPGPQISAEGDPWICNKQVAFLIKKVPYVGHWQVSQNRWSKFSGGLLRSGILGPFWLTKGKGLWAGSPCLIWMLKSQSRWQTRKRHRSEMKRLCLVGRIENMPAFSIFFNSPVSKMCVGASWKSLGAFHWSVKSMVWSLCH